MCRTTGEQLEVRTYERFSPLKVADEALMPLGGKPTDALKWVSINFTTFYSMYPEIIVGLLQNVFFFVSLSSYSAPTLYLKFSALVSRRIEPGDWW
jgi:hypothetical protein